MIRVTRTAAPKVLVRNTVKWTQAIIDATDVVSKEKAIAKYRHKEIKDALSLMLSGKCAYCESYIENVDYGDIEHFKPKSRFPRLAVTWDNLLLSCKKCNDGGQKGDKWPGPSKGGPLINPCREEPDDFFDFIFDEATQVSIVKPRNSRGTTSETVYGLNKHSLLVDRNLKVRALVCLAKYYHTDPEAKTLLDGAAQSSSEYAAFARMVKRSYVPALNP